MIDSTALKKMSDMNMKDLDKSKLVDIETVDIDMALPLDKRIAALLAQMKNPYAFYCGVVVVKMNFDQTGKTIDEYIVDYLRYKKNC